MNTEDKDPRTVVYASGGGGVGSGIGGGGGGTGSLFYQELSQEVTKLKASLSTTQTAMTALHDVISIHNTSITALTALSKNLQAQILELKGDGK